MARRSGMCNGSPHKKELILDSLRRQDNDQATNSSYTLQHLQDRPIDVKTIGTTKIYKHTLEHNSDYSGITSTNEDTRPSKIQHIEDANVDMDTPLRNKPSASEKVATGLQNKNPQVPGSYDAELYGEVEEIVRDGLDQEGTVLTVDYYQFLGLDQNASQSQLVSALNHKDKELKAARLNYENARETLLDTRKKYRYDCARKSDIEATTSTTPANLAKGNGEERLESSEGQSPYEDIAALSNGYIEIEACDDIIVKVPTNLMLKRYSFLM